jgi:uroporphyrinogen-III synthase
VQKGLALVRSRGPWPPDLRAAGVGGGTRGELERQGISNALSPAGGADSEALLALPELASVAGKKIVIFRGEGGRELLGDTLAARGALVEQVACYRRSPPRQDSAPLADALARGRLHAVTSSSSVGLANLFSVLDGEGARRVRETPLFVSHSRIAEEARRLGAEKILVAGPGDGEMVDRLVAYFKGS